VGAAGGALVAGLVGGLLTSDQAPVPNRTTAMVATASVVCAGVTLWKHKSVPMTGTVSEELEEARKQTLSGEFGKATDRIVDKLATSYEAQDRANKDRLLNDALTVTAVSAASCLLVFMAMRKA
jgi:hypothetical protein